MTRAATSDGDVDVDVTLDDLHVMAALCPGSLRLTPCAHRRVDANEEEGGGGGGGGGGGAATADDEIDVLLRVTAPTPGRSARDVPIREEEDARERERAMTDEIEVVIHGQRTSGRIARDDDDGDDDDDVDGTGAKKRRRRRSARTAPGAAAVKKRVDAFRRGVALALAAEMDATRAAGAAAGDDDEKALREIVDALDAAAFARRAEAERRDARSARSRGAARDDALEPLAPLAPPRSTTTTKTKTRCRCRRADALSVDEFIAHLTSDEDALGARGQCAHRIDVPARELKIGPTCDARAPGLSPAVADALHAAGVPFAFAGEGEGEGDRDAAVDRPPRRLSLFSHQHFGVAAALARRNVVVATGTASGKSVCYNAPVLQALTSDAAATALYLFPTKALAQDQLRALRVMLRAAAASAAAAAARGDDARVPVFVPSAGVYDGDTSDAERARIEREDRLVITNPDMLHVNVLPNHRKWRAMLTGLRYVVIDEAHAYRGVFGSHVALVIRRLRRLCRELYGGEPTFIVTSATIAAPGNHARDLVGAFPIAAETETETETAAGDAFTPVWKARETARRAKTHGLSLTSDAAAALGKGTLGVYGSGPRRTSPVVEISALLAECVRHDLKCIAFCKTKKLCELVLKYTREALASTGAPSLCGSVLAYRGGYSSVDRRAIEKALFSGSVRGVAATNALELGVDVGALDVTLHLGFPGTVASLIQQAGRAGRRGKRALSVYVAFDGPLDQHFMRSPAKLFGRPIERAAIDPCNPSVMEAHVACASHEMPLDPRVLPKSAITDGGGRDARLYFGSALEVVCDRLRERRLVVPDASLLGEWKASLDVRLRWCGASPPANGVSVRAIEEERYRIVDERTGECVEEVERSKAFWEVYPGAVYMNQARTFLCVSLDVKKLTAVVRLADVKYFTKMVDKTTVTTLANASTTVAYPDRATSVTGAASRPANRESSAQSARAEVAVTFFGYRKIWHASGTCFDTVPLRETLPDVSYTTIAAWVRVPDVARRMCADAGVEFRAGVHAATHAGAFYTKVFHPSFGFNI
jgi:DEAD/DEAH box helicase domain-containing protein